METASHRTTVLLLTGPAYCAVCSCGWLAKDRNNREEAVIDANTHKVGKLREANAQTKIK